MGITGKTTFSKKVFFDFCKKKTSLFSLEFNADSHHIGEGEGEGDGIRISLLSPALRSFPESDAFRYFS
jgi:hypothetical protein